MFLDQATIHIQSGQGGNGMVAWRREKYVPRGGPAGGDGGKGGSVYLKADSQLSTLLDFQYNSRFCAEPGENGRNKNQHGRAGKDLYIPVPCGTIVRDVETGLAIADLTEAGQSVLVAQGGRGGRGNSRFTSSRHQTPQYCEPGEAGIERDLAFELKLIADVGIIGLPNAGKSTLISVISEAKPKIADYPFTTLTPNLGVVRDPAGVHTPVVFADVPGLIEGASQGVGLGHAFLRHVERTRLLLHLVDISQAVNDTGEVEPEQVVAAYQLIVQELAHYNPKLAEKPQWVVLSKADAFAKADALLPEAPEAPKAMTRCQQALIQVGVKPQDLFVISSATRQGLAELLPRVFETLANLPKQAHVVDVVPDLKAIDNDDSAFEVSQEGRTFVVSGGKIERLVNVTDLRNRVAVHRLMNILKAMGVFKALNAAGAQAGDTILVAGADFEYAPDEDYATA